MYTGNTFNFNICCVFLSGLSLCIQGTQLIRLFRFFFVRFIPVYTGNTLTACVYSILNPVYPCVYREHDHCLKTVSEFVGLSLCIQGTLLISFINSLKSRFIPVYTGNTHFLIEPASKSPVYPCVYREHGQSLATS